MLLWHFPLVKCNILGINIFIDEKSVCLYTCLPTQTEEEAIFYDSKKSLNYVWTSVVS